MFGDTKNLVLGTLLLAQNKNPRENPSTKNLFNSIFLFSNDRYRETIELWQCFGQNNAFQFVSSLNQFFDGVNYPSSTKAFLI